jgi:TolA-binding protein
VGRNQDALTAYQKFIADFPNSAFIPAAYFDMGTIHGKLKEYDEATRNYEMAIQHTKDDVTKSHIRFQIGNNCFHQEDYQSAISSYRKLMDEYPESMHIPEARFMIAESYWWLKDYGSALAGYGEVLRAGEPESQIPYATRRIGECHYQMGDKEMALEWYQKVLDNYPDSPTVKDATYSKIWSLNDLGRYEEAESVGRDYINKYKDDKVYDITAAEIQMMLGDIKFDAEDYISAAAEYLRVVSDYPDLPKFDPFKSRSLLQAGFAYYKEAERNDWDVDLLSKAADAFSQLLDQYGANFDKEKREFEDRMKYIIPSIINLGLSYSKQAVSYQLSAVSAVDVAERERLKAESSKLFDKAREALDMMPKDSPEYGTSMFLKGETYSDEGRVDDAIAVYRQMVEDESLSQTSENMTKAIEGFKKVLETYPESDMAPWAHLGIVLAYEAMGDYDMVVKVAEEIEKRYADSDIPDAKRVSDIARRRKAAAAQKLE